MNFEFKFLNFEFWKNYKKGSQLLTFSHFFIFKNSEKVLRIDIGSWTFQKFIITYLSLPRKSLKTELQLLLPLNFANTKKVLEKRLIFVLFFGGTKFIQKINSISKYRPRLMKLSETHQDISELVWKKFGSRNFIPSWSKFCAIYDSVCRNLTKCWSQLKAKVTPTSDDLLTSNLFYSRITIVRNKKFEFEGILIIISILF